MLYECLVHGHIPRAPKGHSSLSTGAGVARTVALQATSLAVHRAQHLAGRRGHTAGGRGQAGGAGVALTVGLAAGVLGGTRPSVT